MLSLESIQLAPSVFNIQTLIVVNDAKTNRQLYRGSTLYEIGDFSISLNNTTLENLIAFSSMPSQSFESFRQCVANLDTDIENSILQTLQTPRFDHDDGLEEIGNLVIERSGVQQELSSLCEFLSVSPIDILQNLLQTNGIEVDRIQTSEEFESFVLTVKQFSSGELDNEEFQYEASQYSLEGFEFNVECHMFFDLLQDSDAFADVLYASGLCDEWFGRDEDLELEHNFKSLIKALIGGIAIAYQ